jgi:hypothetical protein
MKTPDSNRRLVAILGAVGLLIGLYWTLSPVDPTAVDEPDMPTPQGTVVDRSPSPAAAPPSIEPVPDPPDSTEAPSDPEDNSVEASQPKADAPWEVLRFSLICDVEPELVGEATEGMMHPVTWPGPEHEAQEGGLEYPAMPARVTIEGGVATAKVWLAVVQSTDAPVRHRSRLVMPGFAPSEFSFLTHGPDSPPECTAPIELISAANGVVGNVRLADGSPVAGAIVEGCNARAVAGQDGDFFLLPRTEDACTLRARHSPGTSVQSATQQVDPSASADQVVDFVVEIPDHPQPGVEITRNDAGEVWVQAEDPDDPWAKYAREPTLIVSVGDIPADSLSDEDLRQAMVELDQVIAIQQHMKSAEGQNLIINRSVDDL